MIRNSLEQFIPSLKERVFCSIMIKDIGIQSMPFLWIHESEEQVIPKVHIAFTTVCHPCIHVYLPYDVFHAVSPLF